MPQAGYQFRFQTERGPVSFTVPAEGMKQCPCGCDLFRSVFRIAFARPAGAVGVEPACLRVEVYLCDKCGREILATDQTRAEAAAKNGKGAGTDLVGS